MNHAELSYALRRTQGDSPDEDVSTALPPTRVFNARGFRTSSVLTSTLAPTILPLEDAGRSVRLRGQAHLRVLIRPTEVTPQTIEYVGKNARGLRL